MSEDRISTACTENEQAGGSRGRQAGQPLVTWILIGLNVLVFLIGCFVSKDDLQGYLSGNGTNVPAYRFGMYENAPEWYRLITHGFIHFGFMHLACNMISLFFFGMILEKNIGRVRFALLYTVSLIGGGIAANLFGANGLHAGASGAIWGLMATALILCLKTHSNPLGVLRAIAFNLVYTFAAGASWQGHIGGGITGLIAAALIVPSVESLRQDSLDRYSKWLYGDFERICRLPSDVRRAAAETLSPADREKYEAYAAYRDSRKKKKTAALARGIAAALAVTAAVNVLSYFVNRRHAEDQAYDTASELLQEHEYIRLDDIWYSRTGKDLQLWGAAEAAAAKDTGALAESIMEGYVHARWHGLYFTWDRDAFRYYPIG